MKQLIFPSFILLFSGMLLALIIPDLSTTSETNSTEHIRGIVTDHQTGESLAGVKVMCERSESETYTDFDGMFSLPGTNHDIISLRFDYISYQSAWIEDIRASEDYLQVQLKQ